MMTPGLLVSVPGAAEKKESYFWFQFTWLGGVGRMVFQPDLNDEPAGTQIV